MVQNNEELENKVDLEEEFEEKYNQENIKPNWIKRAIIIILIIVFILVLILCSKLGNIGYKSLTTWGQVDRIVLTDANIEITKDTELNIFNNKKIEGKKIIAPGSKGTYRFSVKNESKDNLIYNMRFSDEMTTKVNMKYKLKMDNIYIRGNEKQYVSIDDLDVDSIIVPKDSINIYTLEWCWVDDDENDLKAGISKSAEYYSLRLEFYSNIYNGK